MYGPGGAGTREPMRFKLGLLAGGGIGWWMASRSAEQKRRDLEQLAERLRSEPLVIQLRATMGEAVSTATEAASRRLTGDTSR